MGFNPYLELPDDFLPNLGERTNPYLANLSILMIPKLLFSYHPLNGIFYLDALGAEMDHWRGVVAFDSNYFG